MVKHHGEKCKCAPSHLFALHISEDHPSRVTRAFLKTVTRLCVPASPKEMKAGRLGLHRRITGSIADGHTPRQSGGPPLCLAPQASPQCSHSLHLGSASSQVLLRIQFPVCNARCPKSKYRQNVPCQGNTTPPLSCVHEPQILKFLALQGNG